MKTLTTLEELLNAATPGTWKVKRPTFGEGIFVAPDGVYSVSRAIAKITQVDEDVERANAELIAEMKNALPALIACAKALALTKASFEDLLNGYPERELHEPYQVTLNRADAALAKLENTK